MANTSLQVPTPFYTERGAAYRWMNPSGGHWTISGQFATIALYCIDDLIEELDGGNMKAYYPRSAYTCDSYADSSFSMHDQTRNHPWMTYAGIIHAMLALMNAALEYTDGEVYNSPFEVWEPGDSPRLKVASGFWAENEIAANRTANDLASNRRTSVAKG